MIKSEEDLAHIPPIIAIDFDETIVTGGYPDINKAKVINGAKEGMIEIKNAGWRIAIWTCRCGGYDKLAKNFLKDNNMPYDSFNENAITPKEFKEYGYKDSRKIGADIYIDDRQPFYEIDWGIITPTILKIYDKRRK